MVTVEIIPRQKRPQPFELNHIKAALCRMSRVERDHSARRLFGSWERRGFTTEVNKSLVPFNQDYSPQLLPTNGEKQKINAEFSDGAEAILHKQKASASFLQFLRGYFSWG